MPGAMPSEVTVRCPRCWQARRMVNVSGGGVQYRCDGCEWTFTYGITTPNTTINASASAGATTLSVASGGASYTNGMVLLIDSATGAEVVIVNGASTGTSIPVRSATPTGRVTSGLIKAHNSGTAFGQLAAASTYGGTGEEAVPLNAY